MPTDPGRLAKPVSPAGLPLVLGLALGLAPVIPVPSAPGAQTSAPAHFRQEIQPLLTQYCYDCHGDGARKGDIAFDELQSDQAILDPALWFKVLKNVRAGLMPPQNQPRPSPAQRLKLEQWIKYGAFGIDPRNPDPGRVTVRRLNRVEYRNTIHDLMGIDFNAEVEFPPDDTGYGFDNIGDVLTLSPMLLEKYLAAANAIVSEAVPIVSHIIPEQTLSGSRFPREDQKLAGDAGQGGGKQGPLAPEHWVRPKQYARFFTKEPPPGLAERRAYANELLGRFASRAFRRPVDHKTLERLVVLAQDVYQQPGKTFEAGIAHAMVAVLASPRFLFRLEEADQKAPGGKMPNVDQYSLASRLSYFLWSTMPDEELLRLAEQGELRRNLTAQTARMLADPRSEGLIQNFTGQWLQTRNVEGMSINARAVLARDARREQTEPSGGKLAPDAVLLPVPNPPVSGSSAGPGLANSAPQSIALAKRHGAANRRPAANRFELDRELRDAMRREAELFVASIVREDRPITDLIEGNYTFLNEKLAKLYSITNVTGPEMRRVALPADSPRGGVLTLGSTLLITSNPDRTSPVKRGLFILENVLGTPSPPPPPNIPALEVAEKDIKDHPPTLREALQAHRDQPLCASCHARLDPLGLAFENFNALGMWRDQERNQTIDAAGKLITGESFRGVQELKRILAGDHRMDFYRCLTEKLLTYALGRGTEYYDVETLDQIVQRLERENGRFSALLAGVIESAPFQKMRIQASAAVSNSNAKSPKPTPIKPMAQNQR